MRTIEPTPPDGQSTEASESDGGDTLRELSTVAVIVERFNPLTLTLDVTLDVTTDDPITITRRSELDVLLVPPDSSHRAVPDERALLYALRLVTEAEPERPVRRYLELVIDDADRLVLEEIQPLKDYLVDTHTDRSRLNIDGCRTVPPVLFQHGVDVVAGDQ